MKPAYHTVNIKKEVLYELLTVIVDCFLLLR